MTRFRLAHASDIHFTLPPLSRRAHLSGKHWAGVASYYLGRRVDRFRGAEQRITALLRDVDAQRPDHAFFSGDLTAISLADEFAGCAALFGTRLHDAGAYTVIPGNHDRYHPEAVEGRFFEKHFDALGAAGAGYPFLKRAVPGISVVALDVARPTGFTHSSGWCGVRQLTRTRELLRQVADTEDLVIVLLHYGLRRAGGQRDWSTHRIVDDDAVQMLLDDPSLHVDMVLHGHMHGAFHVRAGTRLALCAGSATDLAVSCGYNLYDVDTTARTVTVQRRAWDRARGAYVESGAPLALGMDA